VNGIQWHFIIAQLKHGARVLFRPGTRARRYVPNGVSCESFFRELAERQIRYVVLRWFETLPDVAKGEDVDLLVLDEDLPKIDDLFVRPRTSLACDVYSVSGLPGSAFRRLAYYPPYLAEQIISRAVVLNDLYKVPNARDHFLSLAYHVLYHKGYKSGLPSEFVPSDKKRKLPGHDYGRVLAKLATKLSIKSPIDLESLDEYLAAEGWRPPSDMLALLAIRNAWIRDRFFRDALTVEPQHRGVAVFLVRERAVQLGLDNQLETQFEAQGFRVLTTAKLSREEQARVAPKLRGGNWSRGESTCSGGPPARVIVVWDPRPIPVPLLTKSNHPLLDNIRVRRAKKQIRSHLLRGLGKGQRFNPLHSSDNDFQAWEYMTILMPHQINALRSMVESLHGNTPNQSTRSFAA
jgi:hypothetical protein